jgi:hypothetical protein
LFRVDFTIAWPFPLVTLAMLRPVRSSEFICENKRHGRIGKAPPNDFAAILVTPAASASLWLQADKAEEVIEAAGVVW